MIKTMPEPWEIEELERLRKEQNPQPEERPWLPIPEPIPPEASPSTTDPDAPKRGVIVIDPPEQESL